MPASLQFYFLFPLLCVCAFGQRISLAAQPHGILRRCFPPVLVLLGTAVLSLAASTVLSKRAPRLAFFTLPSRFWQLMVGAIVFELQPAPSEAPSRKGTMAAVLTIVLQAPTCVLMIVALWCTPSESGFPVPWSAVAVSAAVGVILLGSLPGQPRPLLTRALSCWPMPYVGRLSYPLYLFHW